MKKSLWEENEIESLFKRLPKIEDSRNAQAIFADINAVKASKTKKSFRYLPLLASAAAIFIFAIISSTILFSEQSGDEHTSSSRNITMDSAGYEKQKKSGAALERDARINNLESAEDNLSSATETRRVLYPSDKDEGNYITLAVPTHDVQYFVPLTILLEDGTMEENMDAFKKAESQLNEASYGLADYYPLEAELSYEPAEKAIIVNASAGHPYTNADRVFIDTLKEMFMYQDIGKFIFKTDGQNGMEFSHMGFIEEDSIDHHLKRAIYLYQYDSATPELYVPSINRYEHISEAFEAMKNGDDPANDAIRMTIPASVHFEQFEELDQQLIVTFSSDTVLEDNDQYKKAIEAMLLAAREFDYTSVQFKNANLEIIGPFNLKNEIKVPIAPNIIDVTT